jgi:protein-disulfide isomerase
MPNNPTSDPTKTLTPRQLAAKARADSEAAERRRDRLIRVIGGVVVLGVVAGLLTVGLLAGRSQESTTAAPEPDAAAPIPTGVQPDTYGVPVGAGWTAENAAQLPTLEIWQDFQCPACAAVEAESGAGIMALANEGKVKLLLRAATFLDNALPQSLNSSARATAAWGCAIDQGKAQEFHNAVFPAQPAEEGTGFTDEQLLALGQQAGITGAGYDQFAECVAAGTYLPWAANSNQKFSESGAGGTPTGYLNGTELKSSDLADLDALSQKIADATA